MSRVHEIPLALRACYLAMHRATSQRLSPLGITADQYVCLLQLSEGGAMIQRELVDRLASDANTVRAMLVLLERKRLIKRLADGDDARARRVHLTAKGCSIIEKGRLSLDALHRRLRSGLTLDERSQVPELLQRMESAFYLEKNQQ